MNLSGNLLTLLTYLAVKSTKRADAVKDSQHSEGKKGSNKDFHGLSVTASINVIKERHTGLSYTLFTLFTDCLFRSLST